MSDKVMEYITNGCCDDPYNDKRRDEVIAALEEERKVAANNEVLLRNACIAFRDLQNRIEQLNRDIKFNVYLTKS